MHRNSRIAMIAALCVLLGAASYAVVQRGMLYPDMTAEEGTWKEPHGRLGQMPATPWSVTTVEAAVNGKPLKGSILTLTGEIVDFSCYLQLGKHGAKHRSCGQKCLDNGQPVGLLAKDGSLYLLMEEEHHPRRDSQTNFRSVAREHMAHIMEVTGTATRVAGTRAVYVSGFVKQP